MAAAKLLVDFRLLCQKYLTLPVGTAGGANTDVQFNDNGILGGNADFTFDKTDKILMLAAAIVAGGFAAPHSFSIGQDAAAATYPAFNEFGFGLSAPLQSYGFARGTATAPAIVQNGDIVLDRDIYGWDGVSWILGASEYWQVDQVPGVGSVEIAWLINTGSAGTERLRVSSKGSFIPEHTVSATIGAVVIDKMAGQCNIAAGQTAVVVTNALVTANSMILVTIASADATAIIKHVVAGAGSFTITTTAAVTADCKVNFLVMA